MATEVAAFEFDNEKVQALIKRLQRRYKDIEKRKELGGLINITVFQDIIDHFDKEEGPNGKWADWSNSYKNHLKKIGRSGNKKLQFSGVLRNSFKPGNWRAKSEGILFYNNAKTKGRVTDDNQSKRDYQKLKRSEVQKSLKKKAKGILGRKIAGKVSKALAKRIVKVEKRKKTKSGKGVPYAAIHDQGLGNMPERKFMWLSKKAFDDMSERILKWLSEGFF